MQSFIIVKNDEHKDYELFVHLVNNSLRDIGAALKQEREKKGLTVRDIREFTCIPVHHILAIESGNRKSLPENLFLVGFIKRYAKAVGLNQQTISNMYLKERIVNNPNYDTDAFDILFKEQKAQQVIHLKDRKKYLDHDLQEKVFL